MENAEKFLKEYEKLCKKYNFFIGACGCCDSPWIEKFNNNDKIFGIDNHIKHLKDDLIDKGLDTNN